MINEVNKLKEKLTFESLYNYFYQIYLNGEYRKINIDFTDFNGSKYITIKSNDSFSYENVSVYEIMSEGTPQEEKNCIRYFNKEGDYSENFNLKDILNLFNDNYRNELRMHHRVELK